MSTARKKKPAKPSPSHLLSHLLSKLVHIRAELNDLIGAVLPVVQPPPPPRHDWKERCQVVERTFEGWDVVSPDGRFRWGVSRQAWTICGEFDRRIGVYTTKAEARKALAACKTPPPGEGGR